MDRQKNYQKYALVSLQQAEYSLIKPQFYVLLTYFLHQKFSQYNLYIFSLHWHYVSFLTHADATRSTPSWSSHIDPQEMSMNTGPSDNGQSKHLPTDFNRTWWKSISMQSKSCLQMNNETRKAIKCSVASKHTRHLLLDTISVSLSLMRISLLIYTQTHLNMSSVTASDSTQGQEWAKQQLGLFSSQVNARVSVCVCPQETDHLSLALHLAQRWEKLHLVNKHSAICPGWCCE